MAQPALLGVLFLFAALLLTGCAGDLPLPYEARYLLRELDPLFYELRPLFLAAQWVFALTGLALLVAGYKIYRFVIALPGFVIGAVVGAGLGYAGADENVLLAILGLILGGLAGAALALMLHDLAVFLLGALIGGALTALIFGGLGDSGSLVLVIIIGAIIGGAGLLALSHLWIVVLSSFVGAVMLGFGTQVHPGWIALFFLGGIAVQYGLAHSLGDKLPGPGRKAEAETKPSEPAPRAPVAESEPAIGSPVLPPVQQIEPRPDAPSPAGAPAATLVSAGSGSEIYQVRDGSLVGRGAGSDIWLRDRTVSRRHARFRYAQAIWFVQDEGSTGGTLVNGIQVTATRLRPGDRIEFGDAIFTFHSGGNL